MSYCRFSSDDFQCDVYAYESVTGEYVVHVAGRRVVFCEPLPPPTEPIGVHMTHEDITAFVDRHRAVLDIVQRSPRETIDLPFAGETLTYDKPEWAAGGLVRLKALGYRVPEYAIEALLEEAEPE